MIKKISIHRLLRCKICQESNFGYQKDKVAPRLNSPSSINRDVNSYLNILFSLNHVLNDRDHADETYPFVLRRKTRPIFSLGAKTLLRPDVYRLSLTTF